jgi:hypothetical protein
MDHFLAALLVAAMEFPVHISKVGKGTTMSWYDFTVFCLRPICWWSQRHINSSQGVFNAECQQFLHDLFCLQVMDMLGPSLWDVWNSSGQA